MFGKDGEEGAVCRKITKNLGRKVGMKANVQFQKVKTLKNTRDPTDETEEVKRPRGSNRKGEGRMCLL